MSDLLKAAAEAQLSPTVNRVAEMAEGMPLDGAEELKTGFATCFHELCLAKDKGLISFTSSETEAMFYGLLAVTLTHVLGKKPVMEKAVRQ